VVGQALLPVRFACAGIVATIRGQARVSYQKSYELKNSNEVGSS